jgi:hypothetical protein
MARNKTEQRVLDEAEKIGQPFTPTQMGMALGYAQVSASSRVAPAIKVLTAEGKLIRTSDQRKVTYLFSRFGPSYSG